MDNVQIKKYLNFIAPNQFDLEKKILKSKSPILELISSSDLSAKGMLSFWDCYPSGYRRLEFDIMTPHQTEYHQNRGIPHDAESPIPIKFLTIPPNSKFNFHICLSDTCQIKEYIPKNWKRIIEKAFEHTFQWLGFGAKTAVGYGTMVRDEVTNIRTKQLINVQLPNNSIDDEESLNPVERAVKKYLDTRPDKSERETSSLITALRQGRWQGDLKIEIAKELKNRLQKEKRWKETISATNHRQRKIHENTLQVMKWIKGE